MCAVTAIPSVPSRDLYLKVIEEMYPTFSTGRLRSNMAFQEDWATTRAVAALKAFTTVKSMITEKSWSMMIGLLFLMMMTLMKVLLVICRKNPRK